ncbi:hypothetical protein [Lacticaseibacillus manihotivorans]|uniref:hypothetical protein n=1 Tax=Lacticaseibacillus manihotivorans TaxID=88233 RepID=UPI0006D09BB1|nr:hypothetical protein [Lacticaseibacillus manihotivorans]
MKARVIWRQICLLIFGFGLLILGTWSLATPVVADSLTQLLVLHQKDELAAKTTFKIYDATLYLQKKYWRKIQLSRMSHFQAVIKENF